LSGADSSLKSVDYFSPAQPRDILVYKTGLFGLRQNKNIVLTHDSPMYLV